MERGVRKAVGFVERAADAAPHRLREMFEDVATLMNLAPLDDRREAARLAERLAEAGSAVDDEELCDGAGENSANVRKSIGTSNGVS
ncbi:MAG TPA: hypothetical protein VKH82_15280 [Candidatus Binatia bacterium]|nr:hypothetical protein [Candidatus Binatia bacterium]